MPVTIGGSGPITGVTSINTTVSDTELGYLDGVSSALQTQINAKAADSSQGLYLITPTSIANSGGSSSASGGAVTFTGVNSISLNGIFTSTYDNYLLVCAYTASASDVAVNARLRASGSDNSSSNYYQQYMQANNNTSSAGPSNSSTATTAVQVASAGSGGVNAFQIEVYVPNLSQKTSIISRAVEQTGTNNMYVLMGAGTMSVTTAYDGITIYPTTGTITSASPLRVYGYKN